MAVSIGCMVWLNIYKKLAAGSTSSSGIEERRSWLKQLPSIIAHVHHRKVTLAHHIVAAIFAFSGFSLIAGFLWAKTFSSQEPTASYMMTNAGLALGVLTVVLAIWTLNQTMRLERLQGERIDRFDELINKITTELRDLMRRYDESRDKALGLFRVILVTNNPFFGVVSYRGMPVSNHFKNAFDALADQIKAQREQPDSGFKVKLICANSSVLAQFVDLYFEETESSEMASEAFIESLSERMGTESVVRAPIKISEAQFAVVGDVVFEFLLEAPALVPDKKVRKARGSNIRATNRIEDRDAADRFERFTYFLEELILNGKGTQPPQGGVSPPPTAPVSGSPPTGSAVPSTTAPEGTPNASSQPM